MALKPTLFAFSKSVLERENHSTTHRLKVTFEAQKAHEATWEVDAVHEKATELVMLQLENESLTKGTRQGRQPTDSR